jgi:hypothetical protein
VAARRHRRRVEPYIPPSGAPPLKDVVRDLFARARELEHLDDEIGKQLAEFERVARERRPTGYPIDVPFPPWGKLAWSGRRGRWRLVVLEDDETCTDLFTMPRECHADACHVLHKLAERMNLL